jgi:undecaprenyl diphosphate synthase
MDGNGRWAKRRLRPRVFGHVRGATVARRIIETCAQIGVENLTLFAFSTENWLRPNAEVSFLMNLLTRHLVRETSKLIKNNIQFHCIGDIHRLPELVRQQVLLTIDKTKNCTGMKLTFALSYGGRQELAQAFKILAYKVQNGDLKPQDITQELIAESLESSFLPDPDLIIRTSGESRISNFFLWQAAYSELVFTEKPWPDFSQEDLLSILADFAKKERRFGRISDQLETSSRNI